jgi:heat shock protein 4
MPLCAPVACAQLKKVLSSIPEAPLNVECLMNDIDFRSSMTREKLEELAAPILERVRAPLAKVCGRACCCMKDWLWA